MAAKASRKNWYRVRRQPLMFSPFFSALMSARLSASVGSTCGQIAVVGKTTKRRSTPATPKPKNWVARARRIS